MEQSINHVNYVSVGDSYYFNLNFLESSYGGNGLK